MKHRANALSYFCGPIANNADELAVSLANALDVVVLCARYLFRAGRIIEVALLRALA